MATPAADPWAVVAQDDFSAPAADDPWAVAAVDPWGVAETPAASDADQAAVDAAWTGAPQSAAPVASKEANAPQTSWAENTGRGIVSRAANLAGGFVRGVATTADSAADWLEQKLPLGQVGQDASGQWGVRATTPEDLAKESPLLSLARSLEETKFGYVPRTTWEDFKNAPLASFIPFVFEQGIVSAPDMAAVMTALPAYVAARTGEIGQERAKNNNLADATVGDFLKATPAAVGSALLERIGTKGVLGVGEGAVTSLKEVPAAALRAGKKEAVTEAGQSLVENVGATLGTDKGFDLSNALEEAAAGAIVGGPFGGTVRAGTASVEAALAPKADTPVGWQNKQTGEGVSAAASPVSPGPEWSPVFAQDAPAAPPQPAGVDVAPPNVTAADVASPLSTGAISSGREVMNRAISGTYLDGDLAPPRENDAETERLLAELEARANAREAAVAPEAPRVSATSPLTDVAPADPLSTYEPDAPYAPPTPEPLRSGDRMAAPNGAVGVVLDVRDRNGVSEARLVDPQGRIVYAGPADTLLSPEEAENRASAEKPTLADVTTPVSKRQPDFRQTNVRDVTGTEPSQGRGAVVGKFAFPQRPSEPDAALPAPQVESADTPPALVPAPPDQRAAAPAPEAVPTEAPAATIEPRGEKSILVRGVPQSDTTRWAGMTARPLWNEKEQGWVFAKKRETEVRQRLGLGELPVPAAFDIEAHHSPREGEAPVTSLGGFAVGDTVDVEGRAIGLSTIEQLWTRKAAVGDLPMAKVRNARGKPLSIVLSEARPAAAAETPTLADVAPPASKRNTAGTPNERPALVAGEIKSFGPVGVEIRPLKGDVFRETNAPGLRDLLTKTFSSPEGQGASVFASDDRALAIGQGANTGVMVTMRGDAVSGERHAKPGAGVIGGNELRLNWIGPDAIDAVEVAASVKLDKLTMSWLRRYFVEDKGASGSVYRRSGAASASPADAALPAETPTLADVTTPVSKRNTSTRPESKPAPVDFGAALDAVGFKEPPGMSYERVQTVQREDGTAYQSNIRFAQGRVGGRVSIRKGAVAVPAQQIGFFGTEAEALSAATADAKRRGAPPFEARPATAPSEDAVSLDRDRGVRAYSGMSFSPEKRADSDIASAAEAVKQFRAALAPLAKTEAQRAAVEEQVAEYKRRYAQHQNAMWDAKGRTLSPMITGPARFPVAKNNKALETERRRVDEFLAWSKNAVPAAKKAVERAGDPEPAASAGGARTVAEFDGAEVEADEGDQRARIYFDAKPGEDLRAALRKEGWLWSPKNEAWQRKLTDNALASARRILSANFEPKPAEQPAPETTEAEKPRFQIEPTPEVTADLPALQSELEKRLTKMALGDKIAVRVVEAIRNATGQRATGRYVERMIEVAIGAKDATQTFGHEVIHALRDLGVIRPAEWSALERASRADKALMQSVAERYPTLTEAERVEEAVAEQFGDWLSAQSKTRGFLRTAFERVRDVMAALGGALRGQGFTSARSVFRAIESGEVGTRETAASVTSEKFQIPPRGDEKPGVYEGIKQWLADRKSAPRLATSDDAGWFKRFAIHPWHVANTDEHYAPVYDRMLRMQGLRDATATHLATVAEPYFKGTDADKAVVNKALEFARLTDTELLSREGEVSFTNEAAPQAQLTKVGETVTLTPKQSDMYRAFRRTMDTAIVLIKQQVLREAGFGNPGDPATAKDVLALIDDDTSARDYQRLTDLAKSLQQLEKARDSKYVPFSRFGDYTVSVKSDSGENAYFERLEKKFGETQRAFEVRADKKVAELRRRYPASQGFTVGNPTFSPPTSAAEFGDLDFVSLEKALEKGGASEETRQAALDAVKAAFTAAGFNKHFIQSKNTAGYETDFERSLADYIVAEAGFLSRRTAMPGIEEAIAAIPDRKPALRLYAKEHLDQLVSPQEDMPRWRAWVFFSHLAGSVGSALVNMTQVPLVTLPYMTMFSNPARLSLEWARASKDAMKMLRPKHAGDHLGFDADAAPADVRAEVQALYADGTLSSQVTLEQMGISRNRGTRVLRSLSDKARNVLEITGALFQSAERFNRLVTAIVAVRMGRDPATMAKARKVLSGAKARDKLHAEADKLRKQADEAEKAGDDHRTRQLRSQARYVEGRAAHYGSAVVRQQDATGGFGPLDLARFVVDETHIVAGKINRPKMMRGVGAAIFQFKNFTTSMVELQWRMATRYGADGRKAWALTLVAGIMAAGLSGITGADDLRELFELYSKHFRGVDLDVNKEIQEAVQEFAAPYVGESAGALVAEFVRKGGFRMLGVDVASRIGLGDLGLVGRNSFEPVPWSIGKRAVSFAESVHDGDAGGAASVAAPFVLSALGGNLVKAYTMATSGLRTQDGGRVRIPASRITGSDVALRALGIQSSEIARRGEYDRALQRAETAVDLKKRKIVTSLGRALAADGMDARALTKFNLIKGEPNGLAGWKQRIQSLGLPASNVKAAVALLDEVAAFNKGRSENETITLTRAGVLNALKKEQGGSAARTVRKSARTEAENLGAAFPNMR
jgi:hypothetical protein